MIGIGCTDDPYHQTYLYIGHGYQWGVEEDNRIDFRLEKLNLNKYDQVWLGGDLCARTTSDPKTVDYLDKFFDLKNPNTHWSVGNHDVLQGNINYITDKTQRPTFYTHHQNGITFLVLNTNFNHPQIPKESDDCSLMDEQFELIKKVTDTISTSSHLLVLHHHNLLTNEIAKNELEIDTIFHFNRPNLPIACSPKGSFQEIIYPLLTKVQQSGVEVVLVCGDVGQRAKEFEYVSKEGITFLGSGINNSVEKEWAPEWVKNFDPDQLLIFHHDLKNKKLRWEFKELNRMIK